MNEICTVYHEAEAVCAAGGHTISVDEMTGIQALEHKYPDKPVIPGKAATYGIWMHPPWDDQPDWFL
ncbi:hypothetical protein [uncultured Acetatifactor sp.]|uniref:hypothetical protein n=1 Tax=uncultured Acetatifactor sp. TaxID=1671927 RepID=UPI002621E7E5|nr:hypothetical protein [uncultured Acetatifactor sp.]